MAISLKLPAPPSDEEIVEISKRNPGFKFERSASGELLVTPAGGEAGWQELELCRQLGDWARVHGGGKAFSPSTGFRMPEWSVVPSRRLLGAAGALGRAHPEGALRQ